MTPSRHERGGGGGEYRHPLNARCSRQADQRNTRWWTLDISTNSQSYHHEDFSGHPRSSPDLGLRAFTDAAERLSSKPSRGSKRRDPVSSASRRWTHVDGSILAIAVVEGGKFMVYGIQIFRSRPCRTHTAPQKLGVGMIGACPCSAKTAYF